MFTAVDTALEAFPDRKRPDNRQCAVFHNNGVQGISGSESRLFPEEGCCCGSTQEESLYDTQKFCLPVIHDAARFGSPDRCGNIFEHGKMVSARDIAAQNNI